MITLKSFLVLYTFLYTNIQQLWHGLVSTLINCAVLGQVDMAMSTGIQCGLAMCPLWDIVLCWGKWIWPCLQESNVAWPCVHSDKLCCVGASGYGHVYRNPMWHGLVSALRYCAVLGQVDMAMSTGIQCSMALCPLWDIVLCWGKWIWPCHCAVLGQVDMAMSLCCVGASEYGHVYRNPMWLGLVSTLINCAVLGQVDMAMSTGIQCGMALCPLWDIAPCWGKWIWPCLQESNVAWPCVHSEILCRVRASGYGHVYRNPMWHGLVSTLRYSAVLGQVDMAMSTGIQCGMALCLLWDVVPCWGKWIWPCLQESNVAWPCVHFEILCCVGASGYGHVIVPCWGKWIWPCLQESNVAWPCVHSEI